MVHFSPGQVGAGDQVRATRQWWVRGLLALTVVLTVIPVLGAADPGGFVILKHYFDHPYVFRAAAFLVVALVIGLGVRGSSRRGLATRVALMTAAVFASLFCLGLGFLSSFDAGMRETNRASAPEGRPYRMIMAQSEDLSNGDEVVYVRSGTGMWTRQWVAACHGLYNLKAAAWTSPDQMTITLQDDADPARNGKTFTIRVNPATGRPRPIMDNDLYCL